ncbi:MAG: sulfatase [Chloroflexi bacterium]|nr:sulfatase [Chloroflexota bacterium]
MPSLQKAPNVVLVTLDSLRRDHVGCYGGRANTPCLDRFATQSLRFAQPYPESLPTIEVRQALYTGRRIFPFADHFSRKGDFVRWPGWHPLDDARVTMAEILRHNGYHTGLVTDVYHQFKPAMNFHRGFNQFRWIRGQENDLFQSRFRIPMQQVRRVQPDSDVGSVRDQMLRQYLANVDSRRHEEDCFAPQVFRAAMRFLEENRERPFFLSVDCFDPHEPWDPPPWRWEPYDPDYSGRDYIWPTRIDLNTISAVELEHIRSLYAGEVTMTDRWLGRFLDHLDVLGLSDDTLVVINSDHGHPLGEHGYIGKDGLYMHPELMDVILLVRDPTGEGAGQVREDFVYHSDVLPTILARLGIEAPLPIDGIDLGGTSSGREYVTSAMGEQFFYRDRDWWLIVNRDGSDPKLFSVLRDYPACAENLAGSESAALGLATDRIRADAGGEIPALDPVALRQRGPWYERT